MLLAMVPAAPPTRKNQRTTSCPAPISAKVPYHCASRLTLRALLWVSTDSVVKLLFTKTAFVVLGKQESSQRYCYPPKTFILSLVGSVARKLSVSRATAISGRKAGVARSATPASGPGRPSPCSSPAGISEHHRFFAGARWTTRKEPTLLLNREVDVQGVSDSREDRVIKFAQHALDLCLGRSIGVEIAGVKKMSLASAQRLQLLGAKIVVPRERRRVGHRVGKPIKLRVVHNQHLMHRFAIGESEFARQTHTLAAYNARRDLWDQGGQCPEVRKERPNLIDVALEYRVAGTNAPGSALWSQCRVHRR